MLPASIFLSALVIGGALVYNTQSRNVGGDAALKNDNSGALANAAASFRPAAKTDHVRGDPNAPIKIIEWSDLECPFCKLVHPTIQRLVADYNGKVAWIYRHFPIDSRHPKARKEAEATECAAELGGNEKFWAYVDKIFEITPSNNGLDLSLLPKIAEDLGLNRGKFETCLESGKYAEKIQNDYKDAVSAKAEGTPHSIIVNKNGVSIPVGGAQPYESFKEVIDQLLKL